MPTTFVTLPYELRLQVYELALEGLLERAPCICAQYCNRKHFTTLRSLALASRKVGAEIRSLFIEQYSHRICFYFDDAFRLQEFHAYVANHPTLRNAYFCLRVPDIPLDTRRYFLYEECFCCEDAYDFYEDPPYWTGRPPVFSAEGIRRHAAFTLCRWEPGLDEIWSKFFRDRYINDILSMRHTSTSKPQGPSQWRFQNCGLRVPDTSTSSNRYLRFLRLSRSTGGLDLRLHDRLGNYHSDRRIYTIQLTGRIKYLTFIRDSERPERNLDALRAELYHKLDSPWNPQRSPSPDLIIPERDAWDAYMDDVPLLRGEKVEEDALEFRWQGDFGDEWVDSSEDEDPWECEADKWMRRAERITSSGGYLSS